MFLVILHSISFWFGLGFLVLAEKIPLISYGFSYWEGKEDDRWQGLFWVPHIIILRTFTFHCLYSSVPFARFIHIRTLIKHHLTLNHCAHKANYISRDLPSSSSRIFHVDILSHYEVSALIPTDSSTRRGRDPLSNSPARHNSLGMGQDSQLIYLQAGFPSSRDQGSIRTRRRAQCNETTLGVVS